MFQQRQQPIKNKVLTFTRDLTGYILEEEFKIEKGQDVLFVGSSQTGCAIVESNEFHNKVIFSSERPMASILSRVKYMDRHGLLDGVKVLIVRFNHVGIKMETSDRLLRSWFQDLPMSWSCPECYGQSFYSASSFLVSHLRIPAELIFNERRPVGKMSILHQTEAWKQKFYGIIRHEADDFDSLVPNWFSSLVSIYSQLKDICRKRNIRMVAVEYPCLKEYDSLISNNNSKIYLLLKEIIKGYGIEVIEFNEEFGEDVFFDEAHMTNKGADIFTRKLYEKLDIGLNR